MNENPLIPKARKEENTKKDKLIYFVLSKFDGLVNVHQSRHPGESRGPEVLVVPGFRLSPE